MYKNTIDEDLTHCTIRDATVLREVCKYVLMAHKHEVGKILKTLLKELDGYHYVRSYLQKIPNGCYVRYIKKDYLDTRIKQGGYLYDYDYQWLYLKKYTKEWKVLRSNHFVFYTTNPKLVPKRKIKQKEYNIVLLGKDDSKSQSSPVKNKSAIDTKVAKKQEQQNAKNAKNSFKIEFDNKVRPNKKKIEDYF